MNKQTGPHRIEWCDYTFNPIGGCLHACRWQMPDGSVAICYAEAVAEGAARTAYPKGFKHHYWRPDVLDEPFKLKTPARIFVGSMADVFGHWVPSEQIEAVLKVAERAHWHTFQLLTKNAPRLRQFTFPPNVWVGVSAPPSWFMGKELSRKQQMRMVETQLEVLREIDVSIRWMSIEPLSFDIAPLLINSGLQWVVIGAASSGQRFYQPRPEWVRRLLYVLNQQNLPIFFKSNLRGSSAAQVWREEFPIYKAATEQARLF